MWPWRLKTTREANYLLFKTQNLKPITWMCLLGDRRRATSWQRPQGQRGSPAVKQRPFTQDFAGYTSMALIHHHEQLACPWLCIPTPACPVTPLLSTEVQPRTHKGKLYNRFPWGKTVTVVIDEEAGQGNSEFTSQGLFRQFRRSCSEILHDLNHPTAYFFSIL